MSLFRKVDNNGKNTGGAQDSAIDSIVKIERKHAEAKESLEAAQKVLQAAQGAGIDGDESGVAPAVERVVGEQAKLDALDGLLNQARDKAIALIAAGSASQRKRLARIEEELSALRTQIDQRRVADIAKFAKARGLNVHWPTRSNGGAISLPAVSLDQSEIEEVERTTVAAVKTDPKQPQLAQLQAERQRINVIVRSSPPTALDTLLAERRR